MNPRYVEARDLEEAWHLCLRLALTGREYEITRGSFQGHKRREIDFILGKVAFPSSRPIVPRLPEGLPQPTDMAYVESYFARYLMSSKKEPGEQYTYGQYIEPQFNAIVEMYRNGGHGTNQATIAIGDASSVNLPDPPCLRLIDTRVQDGKLHFFVYFRSWDLWAGFPSNLAAIQLMKETMAELIGVEDGELLFASKGLHLYDHHFDLARAALRL